MKTKVTVTATKSKLDKARKQGYSPSELLESALDGVLAQEDPSYSFKIRGLQELLELRKDKLNEILGIEERWALREVELARQITKLESEIEKIEQHAKESVRSARITELLREINRAIVYNEYIIPDIKKAVGKQLTEIVALVPDFTLEKQVEIIKNLHS